MYKSGRIFLPFWHNSRVWQTDGQTEFSSLDRVCIPCSAVKMGSLYMTVTLSRSSVDWFQYFCTMGTENKCGKYAQHLITTYLNTVLLATHQNAGKSKRTHTFKNWHFYNEACDVMCKNRLRLAELYSNMEEQLRWPAVLFFCIKLSRIS